LLKEAIKLTTTEPDTTPLTWTAAELRQLPPEERDAILVLAAKRADQDYRHDPELTILHTGPSKYTRGKGDALAPGFRRVKYSKRGKRNG